MSQPDPGSRDLDAGVFVMNCWVREDGELAGRVRWSTVDGEHETRMLRGVADLVDEAQEILAPGEPGQAERGGRGAFVDALVRVVTQPGGAGPVAGGMRPTAEAPAPREPAFDTCRIAEVPEPCCPPRDVLGLWRGVRSL